MTVQEGVSEKCGGPIADANISAREAVRGRCRYLAAVEFFNVFRFSELKVQ
jgi:hypothetical protein